MAIDSHRRPFGVSFLSLLLMIGGSLDVLTGILLLFQRTNEPVLDTINVTTSEVTTYAVLAIVLGLVVVLVGLALYRGANWARWLLGLVAVVRVITLVWIVVSSSQIHWTHAIWPTAVYLLVAGYLFFDRDAKGYFARASQAA